MGFISPTALSTLQTCQLRLAFQRDDKTQVWMRKSTSSALGIVAHRLTELVLKGAAPTNPADRRTWLTERWEGLVHAEWESIQAQWPDRIVDDPKHWSRRGRDSSQADQAIASRPGSESLGPGLRRPIFRQRPCQGSQCNQPAGPGLSLDRTEAVRRRSWAVRAARPCRGCRWAPPGPRPKVGRQTRRDDGDATTATAAVRTPGAR